MFRIRRVYDDVVPINKIALAQIEEILKVQFSELSKRDITMVRDQLKNPFRYGFHTILFVADDLKGKVEGFAFLSYFPELNFCFLDYLSAAKGWTSRGIGGVLYERVRKEALLFNSIGLFFECLPDDPRVAENQEVLEQNKKRLAFYERYSARPIVNTFHRTPLERKEDNPPYVMLDTLSRNIKLSRRAVRMVIREILEKKYASVCTPKYINMVVDSFKDDPVKLREFIYLKKKEPIPVKTFIPYDKKIILVASDQHAIHHIKEKGYVQAPVRIKTILRELEKTDFFEKIPIQTFSEKHILAVHDKSFVEYFRNMTRLIKPREQFYPYIFPLRKYARPPRDLPDRAGYYCIDTFTPITRRAFSAAKRAVDCVLTAAANILQGHLLSYALVRPPGHHAEPDAFGGFCYFNSAAIAANYLSAHGKVAMLDLDHHHGNGQQEIFYERKDVFTVSIHVHPRYNYPFYCGFREERGKGKGEGFNLNVPLPENVDGKRYRFILEKVLKRIEKFLPQFLIIPLGLDTSKRDPTGTWGLVSEDYREMGKMIGKLKLPTLVVQEGGYNNRVLGVNARAFFEGLWSGAFIKDIKNLRKT
jgi:acetoin utilization deacetylase AcuC-like enzyme/GNAT superfamily N-acetyltransferase